MTNFSDIYGQRRAIDALGDIISGDRPKSSFIFVGPEGVGRRTTAIAFAKLLFCKDVQTAEEKSPTPCDKCSNCMMMQSDSHPDLHMVSRQLAQYSSNAGTRNSKQQSLAINVVREFLIDPANTVSTTGCGKIFIVKQSETLSIEAQNALLKTLEEPPTGVTVILLCNSLSQLLPTIRSRCTTVRFTPLDEAFIIEKLSENSVEPVQASFWAKLSDFSIGRSLKLSQYDIYDFKCNLVSRLAQGEDFELATDLVSCCDKLAGNFAGQEKNLAESVAKRAAGKVLLEIICSIFRDAMRFGCENTTELVNSDQIECIEIISERFGCEKCADLVSQMLRYEQLLWRNLGQKVLWDNVAISCLTGAPLEV